VSTLKAVVWGLVAVLFVASLLKSPEAGEAAVYWAEADGHQPLSEGVRDRDITVCFVGDAVNQRPARVEQIISYIEKFETVANIRFFTVNSGERLREALNANPDALRCPSPGLQPNGYAAYDGDIRVALPGFILVDGTTIDFSSPFNDSMSSDPDSVSWDGNRVDVLWRGSWDNVLMHKAANWVYDDNQDAYVWDWSGSSKLGPIDSGVAVAATGPGELHLFHVSAAGVMLYRQWNGDPMTWSDGWIALGSSMAVDPTTNPDAISIDGNRLDVFARGSDDALYHITSLDGGGTWGAWESLGGVLTSAPTVASWGSNRMDVLVRGADNAIWHRAWNGSGWTNWGSLGGSFSSAPDAASWGPDHLSVVAKDGANNLQMRTWDGSAWSAWLEMGGNLTSGPSISAPAPGRLDIFARAMNTGPQHRGFAANAFTDWANIGDSRGGGSWANPPWELNLPERRSCLFNMRLGDALMINHTQHEFGHALGLAHEHERNDVDVAECMHMDGYETDNAAGFLTPYDRDSVMHYRFYDAETGCDIPGDKGTGGLSDWDKLALRILYPDDRLWAQTIGTTVLPVGAFLNLQNAWLAQGAIMETATDVHQWRIDGEDVDSEPAISLQLAEGVHEVEYYFTDFLGREYTSTTTVRVLSAEDYDEEIAGPRAAMSVLLNVSQSAGSSLFLPSILN